MPIATGGTLAPRQDARAEITRLQAENERLLEHNVSLRAEEAMTDIVERLEEAARYEEANGWVGPPLAREAANEIRRLQAENERLKEALRAIEEQATAWRPPRYSWFGETAHAALVPATGGSND